MKIKANDISINYEIKGKGAKLVLIHGAGDNLNMWYYQVPVFSKNYRVITYDVRGFGKTESPEAEHPISLFTKDIYELMKALRVEDACFLGYSMGGRIALELAINHPDMVKALVLANSYLGLTAPSHEDVEGRRAIQELLDKGDIKGVAEIMTKSSFSPGFKHKNPTEFEKYLKVKLQNNPDGLARMSRPGGAATKPPDLRKIKCPTLLIAGENDALMPLDQSKLAQQVIVGSKLVVLPAGHAANLELPEKFNSAVLEFLSEVSGT
ncbi:alpha/beta fold hydrolase [Chloroflexota bacterium]